MSSVPGKGDGGQRSNIYSLCHAGAYGFLFLPTTKTHLNIFIKILFASQANGH